MGVEDVEHCGLEAGPFGDFVAVDGDGLVEHEDWGLGEAFFLEGFDEVGVFWGVEVGGFDF